MSSRESVTPPTSDDRAERVLALLGLARRAGKLAVGATAVEKLVRVGARPVIIVARDAGAVMTRRARALEPVRGRVADLVTRDDLARRLGRNDLVLVAVADTGFVKGLQKLGVVTGPEEDTATSH
jgi:ribosomal protein L7Ae-like RNA K-turn-binding protein